MVRNVGRKERWIRVIGGVALMTLGLTLPIPVLAEEVAETIGLVAVVTGAIGYCPVKHVIARVGRSSGRKDLDSGTAPQE
jgi:hypothetical protein